jgi:hypothetical protein
MLFLTVKLLAKDGLCQSSFFFLSSFILFLMYFSCIYLLFSILAVVVVIVVVVVFLHCSLLSSSSLPPPQPPTGASYEKDETLFINMPRFEIAENAFAAGFCIGGTFFIIMRHFSLAFVRGVCGI